MPKSGLFFNLFLTVMTIFAAAACNNSGGGSDSSQSSFSGQWLGDEILEFRENQDSQFICDRIEKLNDNYELQIDGLDIDSAGNVRDFSLHQQMQVMWKVRSNGSTYDNVFLNDNAEVEGADDVVGHKMVKIDEDTLSNTWTLKVNDQNIDSANTYVRTDSEEVAQLKGIVEGCPKP